MDDVLVQAASLAREANVQLVAERVETMDVYHGYADAGFDVFQGYFFQRPEILANRDLRPAQVRLAQSLNLVTDERVSDQRIAQHFKSNPSLAYQVVRIANVATVGARNIQSVQHAIQLVGRDALFAGSGC
jgi:EAL and modified HD-GYP domain-containing signal transduction protein